MNRRNFLKWFVPASIALSAPVAGARIFSTPPVDTVLAGIFPGGYSAERVGKAFVKDLDVRNPATLASTWLEDPLLAALLRETPAASLRHRVADRITSDFDQGNTVSIDGWVVSVTEARLCGLAYLHSIGLA